MLIIVARALSQGEQDLLDGKEKEPVFLRALAGQETMRIDNPIAWTHASLEAIVQRQDVIDFVSHNFGANVYLGDCWVGSSEV